MLGACVACREGQVKAKHHLLRSNTEEQQKELYTDLNYIHNIAIQELVPIAMLKFTTKWVVTKNEPEMAEYIKKTWFDTNSRWQLARCAPGESPRTTTPWSRSTAHSRRIRRSPRRPRSACAWWHAVVGPQSWDFDTLMDYVHSFYVISQVPSMHPHCIDMCKPTPSPSRWVATTRVRR